jgi:hypothetical protein
MHFLLPICGNKFTRALLAHQICFIRPILWCFLSMCDSQVQFFNRPRNVHIMRVQILICLLILFCNPVSFVPISEEPKGKTQEKVTGAIISIYYPIFLEISLEENSNAGILFGIKCNKGFVFNSKRAKCMRTV